MFPSLAALALALMPALAHAQAYTLVKQYSGATFFDEWDFFGNCALVSRSPHRAPTVYVQMTTSPMVTPCTLLPPYRRFPVFNLDLIVPRPFRTHVLTPNLASSPNKSRRRRISYP